MILQNCPYCGKRPQVCHEQRAHNSCEMWWIECLCGGGCHILEGGKNRGAAIQMWNRAVDHSRHLIMAQQFPTRSPLG